MSPKPPKPVEPRRVGAVARDTEGRLWVNATDTTVYVHRAPWMALDNPERWLNYSDIDVAEVLPDGVPVE